MPLSVKLRGSMRGCEVQLFHFAAVKFYECFFVWLHALKEFVGAEIIKCEWVAASGTRLDRDRPTRQTTWPGEAPAEPVEEVPITDRDEDFVRYVLDEVATRQAAEDAFFAGVDPRTGEVQ